MALVEKCCRSKPGGGDSVWLLEKLVDVGFIGWIEFKDGRVSSLNADVKGGGKDAADFVTAFYRCLLDGQPTARGAVNFYAYSMEATGGSARFIQLTFPNGRILRISVNAADNGQSGTSLEEFR